MSRGPTPAALSQAALAVALLAGAATLCFKSGGYFDDPRGLVTALGWVLVALAALILGPERMLPPSRAGRVALAGLLGLALLTALSLLWAPLAEPARSDAVRLALYAAALPLAVAAFRSRRLARLLEPALAGLALAVCGWGLLDRAGVVESARVALADGRLAQPLSYWNAMGAMAAFGSVLCVRIALDRERPTALRGLAGLGLAPLLVALFLTYSRGAIVALAAGLLLLGALMPEAAPLRRRLGLRGRPLAAGLAVLAVAAAVGVAASDQAAPPKPGSGAGRLSDIGSNRAGYWKVAVGSFAGQPLAGGGTSSFRVEWLREREVEEFVADAHSLYLETAAELGILGLVFLGAFLGGVGMCARRLRREAPALSAGLAAALGALAVHLALDWDWEVPGLMLPALMAAGALMARAGAPEEPA